MNRLHDFNSFQPGDYVEIDFDGFEIDGVQVMPRTRMNGTLVSPVLATIRIDTASPELDIDIAEIGLAVNKESSVPNFQYPPVTSHNRVAEGGSLVFFDPLDVDPQKPYSQVSYDLLNHRMAFYGHVAVNGTLLF